jgi:hypothetical protein
LLPFNAAAIPMFRNSVRSTFGSSQVKALSFVSSEELTFAITLLNYRPWHIEHQDVQHSSNPQQHCCQIKRFAGICQAIIRVPRQHPQAPCTDIIFHVSQIPRIHPTSPYPRGVLAFHLACPKLPRFRPFQHSSGETRRPSVRKGKLVERVVERGCLHGISG